MWNLASIKASLCLLILRKVTTNKNNYVGEVDFRFGLNSSLKTLRVDRRIS